MSYGKRQFGARRKKEVSHGLGSYAEACNARCSFCTFNIFTSTAYKDKVYREVGTFNFNIETQFAAKLDEMKEVARVRVFHGRGKEMAGTSFVEMVNRSTEVSKVDSRNYVFTEEHHDALERMGDNLFHTLPSRFSSRFSLVRSSFLIYPLSHAFSLAKAREARPELAEITEIEASDIDERNRQVVLQLYEALGQRDAERAQSLLAPDLELWFHGPRSHQHMKRLLTGDDDNFHFVIHSVDAFGPTVIAEGTDLTHSLLWIHAWTVSDGVITQVREYFNTSLTVTRVATDAAAASHCLPVWESRLSINAGKSLPGLVLAI
ncbi:uncharacterized protein LOC110037988 [Phalaenopsis equestris]|uniref:uncharacterized protein LOC110037988 n=1 Tax=Phalaenopsis equestris TaxID=78828 RepID=UPI0009E3D5F1|nr:uncharacterized protein LOC110037988 [Phalaenopsis equestris]